MSDCGVFAQLWIKESTDATETKLKKSNVLPGVDSLTFHFPWWIQKPHYKTNCVFILPLLRCNSQIRSALVLHLVFAIVCHLVKASPPHHGFKITVEPHYHVRLYLGCYCYIMSTEMFDFYGKYKKEVQYVFSMLYMVMNQMRPACVSQWFPSSHSTFSCEKDHFGEWEYL